ncbi:MAG: type II secretion system F family protein [Candidatus Nanohaloarchaea archaeon]
MDDEEKERLQDIISNLDRDVKMPPYDRSSSSGYSREYKQYKEEEEHEREKTRYERLCLKMGDLLHLDAGETSMEKLSPPLKLLGWDVSPGMVLSAAVGVGFGLFALWSFLFMLNFIFGPVIPLSIFLLMGAIPIAAGVFTYYKPVYAAKDKVIRSSGEMILSVLYMVIYLRSSPNLEGAVRFAALNLEGPISKDLKGVLWDVEIGKYNRIEESLENYTQAWKDYNDDFLESLQLLRASVNEPGKERRESLLQDAIDRILDGTREKMKHYAQSLKTPVMILNAMGAMLPVLGMIMLPLISVFMGDAITSMHLFMLFNVLLPGFLYIFMQKVLSSRPPTVSSKPTSEEEMPSRWRYTIDTLDRRVPVWPIGVAIFVVVALYGIVGYVMFPYTYPLGSGVEESLTYIPGIFESANGVNSFTMLLRSLSITLGAGLGIGVASYLGSIERKKKEEHIEKIESQFPTALFQLGNKISGGTPVEVALEQAAESTSDLEISDLFKYASRNIREMGMTFEDSIFDSKYGALRHFPSQMINTVMKAINESSSKGTQMASMAMMTISRYLENIHKTQEDLNDLLEDSTTTIEMLAYLLAPVVSGVAVGMSQTIITAMYKLSQSFTQINSQAGQVQAGPSSYSGIIGNLDAAISPEILQLVVGIYLIQLLWILGTFYMKITHGEDKTYRNIFVGKVLISGLIFYTMTLIIIGVMFGGLINGISTAATP